MARYFLQREVSLADLEQGVELEIQPPGDSYSSDDDGSFNDESFLNFKSDIINVDGRSQPRFLGGSDVPFNEMKKTMKPITEDGLILKEVLKTGVGTPIPEKSIVLMHYDAYIEDRKEPFDSTRLRNRVCKVLMDDGNLIYGLELGVKSMKKEEISRFIVGCEYAYGSMGCPPRIPERAELLYEVEIIHFYSSKVAIELEEMSPEEQKKAPFEKIVAVYNLESKICKDLFKKKQYHTAIDRYRKSANLLENVSVNNDEDDEKRKEYLTKLYLNLSLCFIKKQNPPKGIIYADLALKFDPDNVKGLYLMGLSLSLKEEFKRSAYFLYRAKHLKPFDRMINKAITEMEQKRKVYHEQERIFCRRGLGQSEESSKPEVLSETPEFITAVEEELDSFVNSDDQEIEFSSGYSESQLDVVKALAQSFDLAFISKIQCGQKINKVAKKKT